MQRIVFCLLLALALTCTLAIGAFAQTDSTLVPDGPLEDIIAAVLMLVQVQWLTFLLILASVIGAINTLKVLLKNAVDEKFWPYINLILSLGIAIFRLRPNYIGGVVCGVIIFLASWLGWAIAKRGAVAMNLRSK